MPQLASVKVSSRYQIAVPSSVREKLNITRHCWLTFPI
jgi:bifunctional DNA-binding transcriptional regulator/antitoxin component of YhaV-PrlF toxin-antitoxin module